MPEDLLPEASLQAALLPSALSSEARFPAAVLLPVSVFCRQKRAARRLSRRRCGQIRIKLCVFRLVVDEGKLDEYRRHGCPAQNRELRLLHAAVVESAGNKRILNRSGHSCRRGLSRKTGVIVYLDSPSDGRCRIAVKADEIRRACRVRHSRAVGKIDRRIVGAGIQHSFADRASRSPTARVILRLSFFSSRPL